METHKDFEDFKKYFTEYQNKFGLNGWQVYFKYEKIDGSYARIHYSLDDMVATVKLNSHLHKDEKPFNDVKEHAKHEALHLLTARLEYNGSARWVSKAEMDESSEELVNKLGRLID